MGIEVRKQGEEGVLVELRGEFDRHNLENVQETLNDVAALRESTLVDLSGVTFLDVGTSRELVVRSLPYAYRLTLRNPSWQVRASMRGCGFGAWANFRSDRPPTRVSWARSRSRPFTALEETVGLSPALRPVAFHYELRFPPRQAPLLPLTPPVWLHRSKRGASWKEPHLLGAAVKKSWSSLRRGSGQKANRKEKGLF